MKTIILAMILLSSCAVTTTVDRYVQTGVDDQGQPVYVYEGYKIKSKKDSLVTLVKDQDGNETLTVNNQGLPSSLGLLLTNIVSDLEAKVVVGDDGEE